MYTILFRLVFEWSTIQFNLRFLHLIYPMDMLESRQQPFSKGRITNTLTCPWLLGKWIQLCLLITFLRILSSTVLPMSHKVYISYSASLSTPKEVLRKSWSSIIHTSPTKGIKITIPGLLWVTFISFTLQINNKVMQYKWPHRPSYLSKMRVALFDDCLSALTFLFHLGFEWSPFRFQFHFSLFPSPHEHVKFWWSPIENRV